MAVRRGVLLVNIGTPDEPTVPAVRRYLREFLSDSRVLTMPAVLRWLLVNFVIVPFRSPKSAHAYQKVWSAEGSPLMIHSVAFAKNLQTKCPDDLVRIGMRYGRPSIQESVAALCDANVDELILVPLFPQYSEAATGSAIAEFKRVIGQKKWRGSTRIIPDFFADPGFIAAQAQRVRLAMKVLTPDHVLMSYHGLPESHVQATDQSGGQHCLVKPGCCEAMVAANRNCYRAQSFATSRALAKELGLSNNNWSVSFQSRLGRTPWIRPFTDEVLKDLYDQGVRRLMVLCPSFVADCLETIEEIGMRLREDWLALGGQDFALVPCVNEDPMFVDAVISLLASKEK